MKPPTLPRLLVLGLTIAGISCASSGEQWRSHVAARNLKIRMVQGESFRHVVVEKPGAAADRLHVYLDGDGTPWQATGPASDPTPRSGLVVDLMAADRAPSVYLGRPCYHGLSGDPGCGPSLWTMERYSATVVTSMAAALERLLTERPIEHVAWIGYSGGGALAMLLAPRFSQTRAIITVAANLDIDAWADQRGYLRLAGSLNPARGVPLAPQIYQRHYVGSRDDVVPSSILARAGVRPEHQLIVEGYGHVCCWSEIWPAILDELPPGVR